MTPSSTTPSLESLAALEVALFERDFLLTWEHSDSTVRFLIDAAAVLENMWRRGLSTRVFDSGLGVSIFRDHSTRTRYAFRAGCNLLGLATEEIDESTSQIAHGETVRETATMLGFHTETIGIRDDMFIDEGHRYMTEVASALDEGYREGVLAQRPSVINLQSDLDHPTQALADLAHLARQFGGLQALRGKKLAMTWAHSPSYGKPLSVPQGVIALMSRFGMEVVLAHPPGYELLDAPMDAARRFSRETGGTFRLTESMADAFEGADVVYPKSWAPAAVMRARTALLRSKATAGLADLEREALATNARFTDWECTDERMARTRSGHALYMHCLPADVTGVSCDAGEVSRSVFERARLDTYREASYKPFVVAALILATRFKNAGGVLRGLADRAAPRRRVVDA